MWNTRIDKNGNLVAQDRFGIEGINIRLLESGYLGLRICCDANVGHLKTTKIHKVVINDDTFEFWTNSGSCYKVRTEFPKEYDFLLEIVRLVRMVNK